MSVQTPAVFCKAHSIPFKPAQSMVGPHISLNSGKKLNYGYWDSLNQLTYYMNQLRSRINNFCLWDSEKRKGSRVYFNTSSSVVKPVPNTLDSTKVEKISVVPIYCFSTDSSV